MFRLGILLVLASKLCLVPFSSHAQFGDGQKIVIIDSGVFPDQAIDYERVIDQFCISDQERTDVANPRDFIIGPLCRDEQVRDFDSIGAAELPRLVAHNPTGATNTSGNIFYANHVFGSGHGTQVFNEAARTAIEAEFVIVTNSAYDSQQEVEFDVQGNTAPCDIHGLFGTGIQRGPMDSEGCYIPQGALVDIDLLTAIQDRHPNIAAINYSSGSLNFFAQGIFCSRGTQIFDGLKRNNIAVISAAGNGGNQTPVFWPGCNSNVIAVGALDDLGGIASYTSTGSDDIEFFANGTAFDGSEGTSFAAPRVSAAFAMVQSAEERVRTVDEIKFALSEVATDTVTLNNREVPIVTSQTAIAAANCLISGDCEINESVPGQDDQEVEDLNNYGTLFGESPESVELIFDQPEIDLIVPPNQNQIESLMSENTIPILSPDNIDSIGLSIGAAATQGVVPSVRDVILSFEGEFNSVNTFDVFVNGVLASSETFVGARNVEIVLERDYFNVGFNSISIRPRNVLGNRLWGVSNIRASWNPLVQLLLNVEDDTKYGSDQLVDRPTSLRMSFSLDNLNSVIVMSAKGFGVSSRDEIEVYLNGLFQGTLDEGSTSEALSDPNIFELPSDVLVQGENIVEFAQKINGVSGWGVTEILVTANSGGAALQLGILDSTQYGNGFGTDRNPIKLDVDFNPMLGHDHVLSWQSFDIDRVGDVEIFLNGNVLKNANRTTNNRLGIIEEITVAASSFLSGTNTLTFIRNTGSVSDAIWGVTNLKVDVSPIVSLDNEGIFGVDYGYYELVANLPSGWTTVYSNEEYQTRLYATFENQEDEDLYVTLQGWDVDDPQELQFYLNNQRLGFVSPSASSSYGPRDTIELPKEFLLSGSNIVSIRANEAVTSGFQQEKWGVRFLRFSNVNDPDFGSLVPVINYLLSAGSP